MGYTCQGTPTGGSWTTDEAENHINYLETKAVFLGFKSFSDTIFGKSVTVLTDNTTAVAYLNQMGTCHFKLLTRRSKIVSRASAMCVEHLLRATVPKIAFVIYTCSKMHVSEKYHETVIVLK